MAEPKKDHFILFSTNKFSHLQFSQIIKEFKVTVDFVTNPSALSAAIKKRVPLVILVIQNHREHLDVINTLRTNPDLDIIPVIAINNSREGSKVLSSLMKSRAMESGSDGFINIGRQIMF